ncbi:radical SAM protein [Helicobacter sp. CLO-3]|uniref:radical SAM protein n=1 Tax=unclassified Helicobacter TaxID=2593540 RepID=UPI000806024C|nr:MULTISPECIES: radical SAM protein [unclassified Helicobacter]OBV29413.1 radical SAM protein [Helicobacter sp. CLO-3]OHU84691.1 radical SAM protein [Helicobacter sp. CLO-3]
MLDKCCISINARCNIACKYCHFYENESLDMPHIQALNDKKLYKILKNILCYTQENKLTKFTIGFAGGGEPLLDWNMLSSVLDSIKKEDSRGALFFYLITNGILLNKILAEYKKHSQYLRIVVSLDGDEKTHNTNRIYKNKQGTHSIIMQNINHYKELFSAMPAVNMSIGRNSLKNKQRILDFLCENGFKELAFTRLFHCENKQEEITQSEFMEFVQFFGNFDFVIRNLESIKSNKIDCIMYGNKCGVGYNNIFYFDDKIYPCMRFVDEVADKKYILGDYDLDLKSINKNMQKLIRLDFSCKECYYEKC